MKKLLLKLSKSTETQEPCARAYTGARAEQCITHVRLHARALSVSLTSSRVGDSDEENCDFATQFISQEFFSISRWDDLQKEDFIKSTD